MNFLLKTFCRANLKFCAPWMHFLTCFLQVIDPDLPHKLGSPQFSGEAAGQISGYFVQRFRFSKECRVFNFTGDNPGSLAGMRLTCGDICVSYPISVLRLPPAFSLPPLSMQLSLGTSDVLILWLETCPQLGASSACILANPVERQAFMALIWWRTLWKLQCLLISVDTRSFSYCINASGNLTSQWPSRDLESRLRAQFPSSFKNASLVRERFRAGRSWSEFNAALSRTPTGNGGKIGEKGLLFSLRYHSRMRCFHAVLSKETIIIGDMSI